MHPDIYTQKVIRMSTTKNKHGKWRKHHKWAGLIVSFFLIMFCISGIILNHRGAVAGIDISRSLLPQRYEYSNWNGGLLRGTIAHNGNILAYGANGIWMTDSAATGFTDFNSGLPDGADHRQIRQMATGARGELFALSPFGLYHYGAHGRWHGIEILTDDDERLSDLTMRGDTMLVTSRSHMYMSLPPYKDFKRITIKTPKGYDGKISAFRTVWLLHSGELFGTVGKLVVDAVAIVLILLCVTGIVYWIMPIYIKRCKKQLGRQGKKVLKWSFLLHDKAGRYTIVLTVLVALTGWCLRPPMLIPLATNRIPTIPGTATDGSQNAWNDKLRMLRYDDACGDWLLSTSEGFYSLTSLDAIPEKITNAPTVSVMGLNVWQRNADNEWLCGSFSGMFVWNRQRNTCTDFFTHKPAAPKSGSPFGNKAISGYSSHFACGPFAVDYNDGTTTISQPARFANLPMSLWNVALEVHSGRIYMGAIATYIFIFLAGFICLWCLWSGWKVRRNT